MCLDPRPESLLRVRPVTRHEAAGQAASVSPARSRREAESSWVTAIGDGLDARGWTLVTRTATAC